MDLEKSTAAIESRALHIGDPDIQGEETWREQLRYADGARAIGSGIRSTMEIKCGGAWGYGRVCGPGASAVNMDGWMIINSSERTYGFKKYFFL